MNSGRSGSWEQLSDQSWQTDADSASWREDDWYTTESSSEVSVAEEFQHGSSVNCDFEILVLPITSSQAHDRP